MPALEVLEILEKEGLGGRVKPYLAQVVADGATCGNIHELCFSSEDFSKMEIEVYREAARRKLHIVRYPFKLPGSYCSADKLNAFVIAPNGLVFKCWHEVTMEPDRAVGSLLDEPEPYHSYNEDYWLKWDALEKAGCRACDVLPLCHGGCPLEALRHPERDRGACEHYRYHLEPLLELRYQAMMEGEDRDDGPIAKGGGG
jgi:uncharacterized protein